MAHREALKEQIAARMQQAMIAEQMRRDQLKALNLYRDQMMQSRGTQGALAQQKFQQVQDTNQALVDSIMQMDPNEIDPPMRAQLSQLKRMFAANAGNVAGNAARAKIFLQQSKPGALQLKAFQTIDPSTMLPMTGFALANPRGGMSLTPAGGSLLPPGMGATAAATGAPPADDFSSLVADHGLGGP